MVCLYSLELRPDGRLTMPVLDSAEDPSKNQPLFSILLVVVPVYIYVIKVLMRWAAGDSAVQRVTENVKPSGGLIAMAKKLNYAGMLKIAIEEARMGLAEGGIPIGAALFRKDGRLLGRGHNRRVQENDPSAHAETDAFRKAGRLGTYRDTVMVTTLAPCWYCSGLVVQFGIEKVIVGESRTFQGGIEWLQERGVELLDLDSAECVRLLGDFIAAHPDLWNEDIGVD